MKENLKVLIKNLTNHEVGFSCNNFPNQYNFMGGQTLPVKWEHLEDAAYSRGVRFLFENGYLKIVPQTENYADIMDELQLNHLKEQVDNSLSYDDVKKILSIKPLSTQYAVIKKRLKEGTETTKLNFANAAIELGIRDYTVNTAIKNTTGIDVIKTLELKETPIKED